MNGTLILRSYSLILCLALSSAMAAERPTCAVLNFDAKSGMAEEDAEFLSERFATEFGNLGKFQLISRSKMKDVLELQKFARSDNCSATECAIEAGRLLNAQWMVYGSIGKLGNTWSVNAALVSVETGAISNQASVDVKGQVDDLLSSGMLNVARKLAGLPVLAMPEAKPVHPPSTYSSPPPVQTASQPKPKPARTSPLKKKDIPAALKKGLVLYFPFDEGKDEVRDASGNKNNGKVYGAKFVELEDRPSVYEFSGGSDQGQSITVAHSDSLVSMEKTRQLTLSVWIKPWSLPSEFPVVLGKGGNWPPLAYGGYELIVNSHLDNDLVFFSNTGSTTTRNARGRWINRHLNEWIHVVVVVESPVNGRPRCVIYVNGNRTGDENSDEGYINAVGSGPTINFGVTNVLYLGAPDPGHHQNRAWFDGWMDDVMIYNRALDADEVKALHQAQNYQE
ncbi:MAG: hypothetical protein HY343_08555 [Lentisphaerae bacterium]|nr:hypothetical protein [Lentisphaerota bacterium]